MKRDQETSHAERKWPTHSWPTYYEKWQTATTGLLARPNGGNKKNTPLQPGPEGNMWKPRKARRFTKQKLASAAIGSLMLLSSVAPMLHAGTITVTEPTIGGGGGCDLVEAIEAANNDSTGPGADCAIGSGADTINFSTTPATIDLLTVNNTTVGDSGLPVIDSDITIDGSPGGITITRNSAASFRILTVDGQDGSGGKLILEKMTIHNGLTNTSGGGIHARDGAVLTVRDSTIVSNTAGDDGGGIYATDNSPVTVTDSTIVSNTAGDNGGGIYATDNSPVTVPDSTIVSNTAGDDGGGIYATDNSPVTVTDSTIVSNTATNWGGGIFVDESSLMLQNSTVTSNTGTYGGGLYADKDAPMTVDGSTIVFNKATDGTGGGIYASDTSPLTVTNNSTIAFNTATGYGGGIYADDNSPVKVTDSTIFFNTATDYGGGIWAHTSSDVTVTDSTIFSNTAGGNGGGIWAYRYSDVTVTDSTIVSNTAGGDGGGIRAYYNSDVTVTDSTIVSNTAGGDGGGIWAGYNSPVTVADSTIASNMATGNGGGIHAAYFNSYHSAVMVTNSSLLTNTAGGQGGALYNADKNDKSITINTSCIVGNSTNAVHNGFNGITIDAKSNWWGAPDGPGAVLSGSGDTVSADVDGANHLTSSILDCPGVAPEIEVLGNSTVINDGATSPIVGNDTNFGTSAVGVPVVKTFTIQNSGSYTLNLSSPITVTNSNANDFVVTTAPASTSLAPNGGTTTFQVTFTPTIAGPVTATIEIGNNDGDEDPYNFVIQGTGAVPEIEVLGNSTVITDGATSPIVGNDTNFGTSAVGVPVVKTFTIQNSGSYTLNLSSLITVTNSNANDFVVTTAPASTSLASNGGTTTFQVTFTPTIAGPVTATIEIGNNDGDEDPYNFVIQGTGAVPEIEVLGSGTVIADGDSTPDSADDTDFGNSSIGTPVVKTYTINNTGAAALTLSSPTFGGTNPGDFSVTSAFPATIAAGGSATFDVTFNPTASGTRSATLSIVNDDSDENPYNFDIQGTGGVLATPVPPTATFTPFPTATPTPIDTATPTATDTPTATSTNTATSTATPTATNVLTSPAPTIEDFALADIAGAGRVRRSFSRTRKDDGRVQSIRERLGGTNRWNRTNYLVHTWQFNVTGGERVTFYANAFSSTSRDGDTFIFSYSTDQENYTDLFSVSRGDRYVLKSAALPDSIRGTVYIRVVDSDQTRGKRNRDRVYVDYLSIRSESALGE